MNLTKIQMFVKGWDCPKFFKTKKIYRNAISFLRRSLSKLWSRRSVESSLQVLETSVLHNPDHLIRIISGKLQM